MPLVICFTSFEDSKLPEGFETWLSQIVGEVLVKPQDRITVVVNPGCRMCRLGSSSPMVMLQIHSIKVFDKEKNPTYTQKFTEKITEKLNIKPDRVALQYFPLDNADFVGYGE